MKNIIQFSIENGQDGYFVASAADFPIVTQAKGLEDLIKNAIEATELYFEEAKSEQTLLSLTPSIFFNYEFPISLHA